ncbi:MAG: hypothetical protein R3D98_09405 [Candidatus Krumholzibacteriia bacterium]
MTRHISLLAPVLALLALLAAGCSKDDSNQAPRVTIVFPGDGYRYDGTTSVVEVEVDDDGNVPLVEIRLDDVVVSSMRDTLRTQLPIGRWADGLEHTLQARAHDAQGLTGDSALLTVTIDPSLQTIPQMVAVEPDPDAAGALLLSWLAFPAATGYAWEISRTDAFAEILDAGETTELAVSVPVADASLIYVRVRAELAAGATEPSRTYRYDGITGWRERYALSGAQQGNAIYTAPDGSLRLLSYAIEDGRVARADVELLRVAAAGEFISREVLLDATHLPTTSLVDAEGTLLLGGLADGVGFLAGFTLDGAPLWRTTPALFEPTALMAADGGEVWVFGADLREGADGGAIQQLDPATGQLTELATFQLEAGRRVLAAWPRPDAGWVVAGRLPDTDAGNYGGLFARGLDGLGATDWNLRIGEADRWLWRGCGQDGHGNYVLCGIAFVSNPRSRYGFLVSFDHRGRLRWQLGETNWHLYSGIMATEDGRWTAVGARRRYVTSDTWLYDTALRGLSEAGLPLWQIQHRLGEESQGFGLAPHPDGGWYVTGFTTPDRSEYDVDLLRLDDRGELE